MHFAKGRSSPFGEVGYAAPFDGKLTKSLELKLLLKFALQPFDFVTPYCTRKARGRCIVFSISCFSSLFGDKKCEAFIAKYFGVVKGTCICSLKRIAGLALRINMYC